MKENTMQRERRKRCEDHDFCTPHVVYPQCLKTGPRRSNAMAELKVKKFSD